MTAAPEVKRKDNGGRGRVLPDGYGRASRGRGKLWLSPVRTVTRRRGSFGLLSSAQPRSNHEAGPPGAAADVHGLLLACDPAQQQPLPQQEAAQGAARGGDQQAEARRVS